MKRIMIAAMGSGSGKTVLTCGLMRALQRRGMSVAGLKCGPDYIDPMFHSRVLGIPCRNLDLFLQGEDGVRKTLSEVHGDIALLEGAMGYYDGLNGTTQASAWETASAADAPAVLVLRPKGQSITLAAQVRGMTVFRVPSRITGLMLTDCTQMLYGHLRPILERETGIPVLGFLPHMKEAEFESRHLGLVTAGEIRDISRRFDRIADALERNADLDRLLKLAKDTPCDTVHPNAARPVRCRIAVARDEAFSFYYADNLDALRAAGAELVFFSPIRDDRLPDAEGLYLGGGYPENWMKELSDNRTMLDSVRRAVCGGMPTVAECGGYLYLQQAMRDGSGEVYEMAGVLPGIGYDTGKLSRFGYLTIAADGDSLLFRSGERIPAHSFHYWDITEAGNSLLAVKADGRKWRFGSADETMYAGFPHLHWGGAVPMAERFAAACSRKAGGER